MTLRPYQAEAVAAAWSWMRQSTDPFLIEAATGAGKSHIIAKIAAKVHTATGKKVLCLAPSGELIEQNFSKYLKTGNPASMYSASTGQKSLRHPVVFGSPLTVKNRLSRFADGYAMVFVDECHGLTPTVKTIIETMRAANPLLRIGGTTATPYRLNEGYIFSLWPDGTANDEGLAREPFFLKSVYRVDAPALIKQGYLTAPVIGQINAPRYDTGGMEVDAKGRFRKEDVDRAYHGHGRETAAVVADVVHQSRDRRGVMLFAATVRHAQEVLASLPPEISAIVTGETPKKERKRIIERFQGQAIKYIVNVGTLTTGFDATHVDVIAILRKTESVGLLQQIVGRGMRLHPGKADCLVLDYTTNLDDHCPDGDLFSPVVRARKAGGDSKRMEVICPECGTKQELTVNPDYDGHRTDAAGYLLDDAGQHFMSPHGPIAAHFGRRCFGHVRQAGGGFERCNYRWTHKECPHCAAPNDIAARYCIECKGEIVDPNEKLIADFRAMKRDPSRVQTDKVLKLKTHHGVSARGNRTVRADFETEYRTFSAWYLPDATFSRAQADWARFQAAGEIETVTYAKQPDGFYRIYGFNGPADVAPDIEQSAA